MAMFDKLLANLKASRKKIVFTEGTDARILSAASRLLAEDLMDVILCGNPEDVKKAADENKFDITKAEILDPLTYPEMDAMVSTMAELRKGKMTEDECRTALQKSNYFGTMLVKMGKADALLGGATYSTADTVRPALQIVKTKKGSNLVSSSFILFRQAEGEEEKIAMGDCAINLSFSTYGSGKGGTVQLSHDAVIEARKIDPELTIDGEFQFDAAVSEEVAAVKCPDSKVAGQANTFIFPLIEAGNIGYKIAQRLGGFAAYGPILQGLNAPINDLSRGCDADEVYKMAIITAGMA